MVEGRMGMPRPFAKSRAGVRFYYDVRGPLMNELNMGSKSTNDKLIQAEMAIKEIARNSFISNARNINTVPDSPLHSVSIGLKDEAAVVEVVAEETLFFSAKQALAMSDAFLNEMQRKFGEGSVSVRKEGAVPQIDYYCE